MVHSIPHSKRFGYAASRSVFWLLLGLLVTMGALSGCMPRKEISFYATQKMHFSIQDSGRLGITLLVEATNLNPKPLTVREVHLDVWQKDNYLGYLFAPEPIVLPPHFADTMTVRVTMQFDSPGKIYGLLLMGRDFDPETLEVAGYFQGGYGSLSRRVKLKRQLLKEALPGIQQLLP